MKRTVLQFVYKSYKKRDYLYITACFLVVRNDRDCKD